MENEATITVAEAVKRHVGLNRDFFVRRCKRGERLISKYGGRDKIPPKEISRSIFARKQGKFWIIPVSELNRLFL